MITFVRKGSLCLLEPRFCIYSLFVDYIHTVFYYNSVIELFAALPRVGNGLLSHSHVLTIIGSYSGDHTIQKVWIFFDFFPKYQTKFLPRSISPLFQIS
jgi:hypothetical protein